MRNGVAFFVALLMFSAPAVAQEESKLHLLLNGGVPLARAPVEFKEGWRPGLNLGGGVGYRLSRYLSLLARVHYDQFPANEQGIFDFASREAGFDPRDLGIQVDIQGAEVSIASLSGELKASLMGDPEKISPYVMGGLGVAHVSLGDVTLSASFLGFDLIDETIEAEPETVACALFGGGVDVPLEGRFVVFVEGRYQWSFTEDERTGHVTFTSGLRISIW